MGVVVDLGPSGLTFMSRGMGVSCVQPSIYKAWRCATSHPVVAYTP